LPIDRPRWQQSAGLYRETDLKPSKKLMPPQLGKPVAVNTH